ncbi:hypothetical protein [Nocardiopsis sp. JB363]|uniref:hypothetical protein n=1 Tax=Nocardiopsis sp. JB363 TaxID=1434837 RepID=UPI000B3505EB|nr:hypothetical protein [Nocardiopsis sp. JB363]
MSYPMRVPPYTGWAEQQTPTVMAHRARAAADAQTGLALLEMVAARQAAAQSAAALAAAARFDSAQWAQLRSGVRHLLTRHPDRYQTS